MLETSMVVATVPVTDLARAKRFHAETLGLTFPWESPARESPASVRFGCGGGTQLSNFRRAPSTADHTPAHFEVSDIEAAVRELEERDVRFIDYGEGPLQTTGQHRAGRPSARRGSATRMATPSGFARGSSRPPRRQRAADSSDVVGARPSCGRAAELWARCRIVGALPPLPIARRRRP
jgi:catechol 2,3-dioxygenase-like lactoylglutathione lyase family enzyme